MSSPWVQSGECTVSVSAPAGVVYGLLADAVHWPVFVPGQVHVERVDFDGVEERLLLWEAVSGRVRSCHVRRLLRPYSRSVVFEQHDIAYPDAVVSGVWAVRAVGEERCLLTLRHDERSPAGPRTPPSAAESDPVGVREQVARVREMAERWAELDELLLSFEDSVRVQGPAELVHDFLYDIGGWAGRVPHVERARVTEDVPGVQLAVVDSCAAPGGQTVTTETVRLCFPHAGRIVFKETVTPALIAAHSGEWSLVPDASGVRVVCTRRVMLRQEAVRPVLGEGTSLPEARRYVREWLGRAGTEVLGLAKWHAESAVRRLR
ncbi:SRPBCC family protein [Streptomyces sp. NPDC048275]|uniref:SRPBCC family protein n=1 Tax=Streptomyces sp. NPDC048275 TaxID=3155629 RepID=UPI0033F87F49